MPDEGNSRTTRKTATAIQQFTELVGLSRIAAADLKSAGRGICWQTTIRAYRRHRTRSLPANGGTNRPAPGGQVVEEEPDPTLRLSVSAYIPETTWSAVINGSRSTRLSSCGQLGDLALMHGEIEDRYGGPPRIQSSDCSNSCRSGSWPNSSVRWSNRRTVVITFDPKGESFGDRCAGPDGPVKTAAISCHRSCRLNSRCRMTTGVWSFQNSTQPCKPSTSVVPTTKNRGGST